MESTTGITRIQMPCLPRSDQPATNGIPMETSDSLRDNLLAVSIGGLHVLDLPGVEIMEGVQMSHGVRQALSRGPETRPCFCWRDVARKVLINGGDPRGTLTMRFEVEDDEMRCEGIQCTSFLELQARLLMNARSSTSKSDRHAVIIGHSDKYVIQTLRRILATIGAQSRKTS